MNKQPKCRGFVATSVLVAFFIGQTISISLITNYEPTYTPEKLYKDKISAIVSVYAIQMPKRKSIAGGTGFFVSKEGLIVTAAHVIYDDDGHPKANVDLKDNIQNFIFIKTRDRKFYKVEPVRVDLQHDIAILKVTKTLTIKNTNGPIKNVEFVEGKEVKTEFPTLQLVKHDMPIPGETVMAIGFPGRFNSYIAIGIIASPKPQVTTLEDMDTTFKDIVLTSMLIFPGNSGGPVFNRHGKVIGIATLGSSMSVSFYQRTIYIKRLLTSKSKELITYQREHYDEQYDN